MFKRENGLLLNLGQLAILTVVLAFVVATLVVGIAAVGHVLDLPCHTNSDDENPCDQQGGY